MREEYDREQLLFLGAGRASPGRADVWCMPVIEHF